MANAHSKMTDECVFTTNECALMKNTHSKMTDECVFMTNECALMRNTHSKMPDECVFFYDLNRKTIFQCLNYRVLRERLCEEGIT